MKRIKIELKKVHLNLNESFVNHLEEQRKEDELEYKKYYKNRKYWGDYYDDYYDYYDDYYPNIYPSEDYWDEEEKYWDDYYNRKETNSKSSLEDEEDDYDFKEYSKKHAKKSKVRKKKEVYSTASSYDIGDNKIIFYYPDYLDIDNRQEFDNVYDFDKFLSDEGIEVPSVEITNLFDRTISHCAINPKNRLDDGILSLITKDNYLDLRNECSELESSNEKNESEEKISDYAM